MDPGLYPGHRPRRWQERRGRLPSCDQHFAIQKQRGGVIQATADQRAGGGIALVPVAGSSSLRAGRTACQNDQHFAIEKQRGGVRGTADQRARWRSRARIRVVALRAVKSFAAVVNPSATNTLQFGESVAVCCIATADQRVRWRSDSAHACLRVIDLLRSRAAAFPPSYHQHFAIRKQHGGVEWASAFSEPVAGRCAGCRVIKPPRSRGRCRWLPLRPTFCHPEAA